MNRRNKGFTLVELQVASAIALITLSAVLTIYLFSWRSFTIGNTLLDVYANSRNASGWLMRDIRCAAQVVKQYPEIGSATYQTGDHVIVLKVPSIEASGQVITPGLDYIIYRLQGSYLYRIVQKDASSHRVAGSSVIAHDCTDLTFSSLYQPTGEMKTLSFYDGTTAAKTLSTINTVSIYLPINKTTISLSGAEPANESLNPTTIVRLRNKE